jgi:tRNA nucleotidyltransferase (CCA-adding enzyme)
VPTPNARRVEVAGAGAVRSGEARSGSTDAFADAVQTTAGGATARLAIAIPVAVTSLLDHLQRHGHAAYVVGGSLRDALLGRAPADWDLATDARPDDLLALFPGTVYENRFGTVAVRRDHEVFEITTFRTEHDYADFRRPHRVEFGDDVVADLARRDFTVNAIAWGGQARAVRGARAPFDQPDRAGPTDRVDQSEAIDGDPPPALVDPFGGLADLRARRLRAVGDPEARFREDALRMIRAVRLAATLGFDIEPATLAAIGTHAPLASHLSGERVGAELSKLLAAPRPSVGLRVAADTGLLAIISADLAAQRGIPQNKVPGEDLWDHTLRSVDAVPADRPVVRLAALLHDIGKPSTLADGKFHHHEAVGAAQAEALLRRLRYPKATIDEVAHLVRHHMFTVDAGATDVAVRRFIRRIGRDRLDALFELRRADDIGSGMPPDDPDLASFRSRVEVQLAARPVLDRHALVVDGGDLMHELGLEPGPRLGRVLEALVEAVIADPVLNDRATLMLLAQGMLADMLPDDELDDAPDDPAAGDASP